MVLTLTRVVVLLWLRVMNILACKKFAMGGRVYGSMSAVHNKLSVEERQVVGASMKVGTIVSVYGWLLDYDMH